MAPLHDTATALLYCMCKQWVWTGVGYIPTARRDRGGMAGPLYEGID